MLEIAVSTSSLLAGELQQPLQNGLSQVTVAGGALHLLLVTDPDDRDEPALLLSATLADPHG